MPLLLANARGRFSHDVSEIIHVRTCGNNFLICLCLAKVVISKLENPKFWQRLEALKLEIMFG